MAREYRNVSGSALTVRDSAGVWRTLKDGEIIVVAEGDNRDWPTSDTGAASPNWAEVTLKAAKATKEKKENS